MSLQLTTKGVEIINGQSITGSLQQLPICTSVFAFMVYILFHPSNREIKGVCSFPVPFSKGFLTNPQGPTADKQLLWLELPWLSSSPRSALQGEAKLPPTLWIHRDDPSEPPN